MTTEDKSTTWAERRLVDAMKSSSFIFEQKTSQIVSDATLSITEKDVSGVSTWFGDAVRALTSAADLKVNSSSSSSSSSSNGQVQFAVLNLASGHSKVTDLYTLLETLGLPRSVYVSYHTVQGLTVPGKQDSLQDKGLTLRSISTFRCGVASAYDPETHATVGVVWFDSTNNNQVLEMLRNMCKHPMLVFHPLTHCCFYTKPFIELFTARSRSDTNELFKAQMDSGFHNYAESSPGKAVDNLDLAAQSGIVCGSNINMAFFEQNFRALHILLSRMQQQNSTMTFGSQIPASDVDAARLHVEGQLALQIQQAEYMIEIALLWQRQASIVTQGIFNLIAQRDSKMNIEIAKDSKFLAEQSQRIAEESKKDTTSMEAIAAVTMFFLPATFVASFLAMPIFQLNANTGRLTAYEMWLFWVITIPLTIATIVSWLTWTTLSARKRHKQRILNEKSNG